ncbi:MAG: hypothetical protein KF693_18040 [Nitrospira sp.]|nr:hypothetical protein [Nitrospira sp.]
MNLIRFTSNRMSDGEAKLSRILLLCKETGRFFGLLTCGSEAGFFVRKALGIDVAYQALLFESRTVTGSPNPTVNGTYETTTHASSMTMRVNF